MDALFSGELQAFPRILRLEHGLYAIHFHPAEAGPEAGGMVVPCLHLASPPSPSLDPVDIMTAWNDQGAWIGVGGGTVVARVLPGGGQVLATLYGGADASADWLDAIVVQRIDAARAAPEPAEPAAAEEEAAFEAPAAEADAEIEAEAPPEAPAAERIAPREPGEIDLEIALHMQSLGDAMFEAGAWCGQIGARNQIEAFGVQAADTAAGVALEYMAFGPAGRETRWVADGKLCGTRGRGMPLTGFAIRLAPGTDAGFEVTYQGAFFDSGVTLPCSDGTPCLPALADDRLEAILVRVRAK